MITKKPVTPARKAKNVGSATLAAILGKASPRQETKQSVMWTPNGKVKIKAEWQGYYSTLLDDVIVTGTAPAARTARNLASTYASRIYARIEAAVTQDPHLPEPELEHYFKVVLAFDQVSGALPPAAAELKIAVVRQLVERYYEGHPAEKKRQVLEQLAQLGGES